MISDCVKHAKFAPSHCAQMRVRGSTSATGAQPSACLLCFGIFLYLPQGLHVLKEAGLKVVRSVDATMIARRVLLGISLVSLRRSPCSDSGHAVVIKWRHVLRLKRASCEDQGLKKTKSDAIQ